MDVTGPQGMPYFKMNLTPTSNKLILILSFSVSTQYLKNGLTDSIQIWHVVVTGIQGVSSFNMTLNSNV